MDREGGCRVVTIGIERLRREESVASPLLILPLCNHPFPSAVRLFHSLCSTGIIFYAVLVS